MKTLYLDCGMGAAGDMLTAALLELTDDAEHTIKELNAMHIPGVTYQAEKTETCGIVGTHVQVLVDGAEETEELHEKHMQHTPHTQDIPPVHTHRHTHHSFQDITHLIRDHLTVSESVKAHMIAIYRILADAESRVHGVTVDQIHFHEVGTMDAIADIAAVCYLMEKLGVEQVIASPVHVGRGRVKCAHGILPVPAPATALILQGIPIYSLPEVEGELCTPTGAALLKYFARDFDQMPPLRCDKIGYGMGRKKFPIANCVRAFLGETTDETETIFELSFTVDDMTGEEIGFATQAFLEGGARDVFTTAVGMKKGRPGILITVLTLPAQKDDLVRQIFRHTTTLGIRETLNHRYVMRRETAHVETDLGIIRRKDAFGYGVSKSKYEYEDLARAAKENDRSIREIRETLNEKDGTPRCTSFGGEK